MKYAKPTLTLAIPVFIEIGRFVSFVNCKIALLHAVSPNRDIGPIVKARDNLDIILRNRLHCIIF